MRKLGITQLHDAKPRALAVDQIKMIKDVGFDLCSFKYYNNEPIELYANEAAKCGIGIEALHAKNIDANSLWKENEGTKGYIDIIKKTIDTCHDFNIGKMVMHTMLDNNPPPVSEFGINNFLMIASYAKEHNVHIAFENMETPEHIKAVLNAVKDNYHGLCWDCGHNYGYTPNFDVMSILGDRLMATHIHDNFGLARDWDHWYEADIHLLPFDGNYDFKTYAAKIKESGYKGPLTFELSTEGKKEYGLMSLLEFFQAAYKRACVIRDMCE
ncbi:MAG: sugar phosphate isomerase/epimerase family protein [Bacillota bacterium]|nr:sugar phosphate isomerase/epimerase family protein [Bacillota bacterium]